MRPTRRTAFAVLVGSFLAVGCVNTDDREEPLMLGKDTQNRLVGGAGGSTGKAAKVAAFDPSATGGTGVTKENSFNRTVPGPGTGSSTGNFASTTMPSQVGLPPAVSAPTRDGVSQGELSGETGRTAMTHRAAAPSPPPAPKGEPGPFGPTPPRLAPPESEPPVRPVVATEPAAPAPPSVIPPVMPEPEKSPLPVPVSPITPVAPVPPASPGAGANEPLPMAPFGGGGQPSSAPAPPTYVPSPTEVPIPSVQAPPKLPPAPPIRPNG